MIASLFKKFKAKSVVARQAHTPADTIIWAVGDVHGRLDLLNPLVEAIVEDLSRSTAGRKIVVFLGDYIDRGPDSCGVLNRLSWLQDQPGIESHFLRGNHEDRMEAFLEDPEVGPGWCEYGGREALRSYGVTPPAMKGDMEGWTAASLALNEALPDRQRLFLNRQEPSFSAGDYFFAHAGAKPGLPLTEQSPDDLMWIRQGFLDHPDAFEQVVVHGHTPGETIHADARRIGIDTGAYATGVLSGIRLEGTAREVVQTRIAGRTVSLSRTPV